MCAHGSADRARGFGPRGRGFESLWARHLGVRLSPIGECVCCLPGDATYGEVSSMVERQFVELHVTGSTPVLPPM